MGASMRSILQEDVPGREDEESSKEDSNASRGRKQNKN